MSGAGVTTGGGSVYPDYDARLVVFSVAIAIDVALISLWLAFRLLDDSVVAKTPQKVISAMIMGLGVSGMHYLGRSATKFVPRLNLPIDSGLTVNPHLSPSGLAIAVGLGTVICLFFIVLTKLWDHKLVNQLAREKVLKDSEQQFRTLIQQMQVGMLLLNAKAEILVFNQAALDLLRLDIEPDSLQVFGEGWHLVMEDGSPISLSDLPVQRAIATGEAVHHLVLGFDDPTTQQRRWLLVNATLHEPGGEVMRVICTISDITNQKQAEEALRRSQERFTLAVEGANDGIWDWDISTDEVYLSPRGKIMFGCQPDLDCFSNLDSALKIVHPDDRLWVKEMLNSYLAKEIPAFDVEYRTELDHGEWRWIRSRGVALWDEHNQPYRMVGFHTDITDRKMAEQALREGAEQERSILQMVQQMRKTLELEQIFSATTGELRQVLNCDRVLVYRFREDWSGEFMAESVAEGWVQLTAGPLRDSKATRIAIEQEKCAFQEINYRHVISDTYLQQNQGGIYGKGVSYRCVNDIYEMGFDACYLELLKQFQARAYIITPIFSGYQLWGLLAVYQNYHPRIWTTAEIRTVTQIGSQLGVAVQQAELLAKTQEQARQLQQAKEIADAANRSKSEFLANMSHELRTPLNAILGFAQLMSTNQNLAPENRQHIEIINRSGEHLLGLINDILEMSRIEAGRATLQVNGFDLYEFLQGLEDLFKLRATSKNLHLIFERPKGLIRHIKADEKKLRQVLINLLGNAIKFTDEGSVTVRVSHQNRDASDLLQFEVEDTGLGIAPEDCEGLFEAFAQTETGLNASEGSGLGLAIAQQFVKLMGDEITVRSCLNRGSTFSFTIPVQRSEDKPNQAIASIMDRVIGLAADQPVYRILVVEDRESNRLLLVELLSVLGFSVRPANNGSEAIAIWQEWNPDLIFMDMRMPVVNGYEATRQIRSQPGGGETIIIALTASAFEEQRQDIMKVGCNDLLRKPFQRGELLSKLSQYLGVQYIYNTQPEMSVNLNSSQDHDQTEPSQLNLEQIREMPEYWLDQVYSAAAQGSDLLLLDLIEEIPTQYSNLANTITEWVGSFQFDKVLELVEQTKPEAPNIRQIPN
ncbi:ATP-binding protein [Limnospira sp. PMC 289.06]|uniref:ATP-binding protein n=2 Tax=Limnospira TaxID=2596745 RepID=UPI003DA4A50D